MDLYDLANPVERMLADKADAMRIPLGGTMELLPLCNMNCKMCYIRLTPNQMRARGRMLDCKEWLRIAEEAKSAGVLYLLLTGGEPLLYPEFERLYNTLIDMGFILTINTNGTLLDEHWVDIFAERPCKRINVTLYGSDRETYGRLCGDPDGFDRVMKAARLLRERNLLFRFNCSVTPDNVGQLDAIAAIARDFGVPLEPCSYMFPPVRRKEEATDYSRMTPKEAAKSQIDSFVARAGVRNISAGIQNTLRLIQSPEQIADYAANPLSTGLTCRAGRSGFWMNWMGELLPCGMFDEPKISLLEHSFGECWDYIVSETAKIRSCPDCRLCPNRRLCKTCGAACLAETCRFDGRPEYLCEMTDELVRQLYRLAAEYRLDPWTTQSLNFSNKEG